MAYYTTAYPTVASYFDKYHQPSATKPSSSSRPAFRRSASSRTPAPAPTSTPMYMFPSNSPSSLYSSPYSSGASSRTRSRSFSSPAPAIEPLLAYHSHSSNVLINYDISHPPSQATLRRPSSVPMGLSSSDLGRPATYPPVNTMYITCPYIPWTITVYPLSSHHSAVTVGDVLETLFRSLRKHVSGDEWHKESSKRRESVRQAWLRRVKRQHTHKDREYERNNGLRRIDWLEKMTVFQGLELAKGSKDTWILHVRQGDKTVKFWNGS